MYTENLQRMENKLVATIRIFFPSGQFIVDCKGHTFFKPAVVICSKPYYPVLHLQTKTDVKIFGNVCIGPPFGLTIRRINKRNTLEGFPAKESVMTNEWCNIAGTNTVLDSRVNDIGKVSDYKWR